MLNVVFLNLVLINQANIRQRAHKDFLQTTDMKS